MPDNLTKLRQHFDSLTIAAPDTPVLCSIVTPKDDIRARLPDFPDAATPEFGRVANGRGLTESECLESGLGEAAELASCSDWGDAAVFQETFDALGDSAISPAAFLGLSEDQMAVRDAWNASPEAFDWRPAPCPSDRAIDWVLGVDGETGGEVAVPADAVYIGRREAGDGNAAAIADSNGCACGKDESGAKLSALLELIERDATGRWWYGERLACSLSMDLLNDWPDLARALETRRRRTLLFDITSDIPAPCVAAISSEPDDTIVAVGFSAAVRRNEAVKSAVTEMIQTEFGLLQAVETGNLSPLQRRWLNEVSAALPWLRGSPGRKTAGVEFPEGSKAALEALLEECRRATCRVVFVDMTRDAIGVPAFRAISPDLCHYKPRFGRLRLLGDTGERTGGAMRDRPNPVYLTL